MEATKLLEQLQKDFPHGSTFGSFNVDTLQIKSCRTLFAQHGFVSPLRLRSETGWRRDDSVLTFQGVAWDATLLKVETPCVFIRFELVGGQWELLLGINLPLTWTYQQSFTSRHAILDTLACRSLLCASAAMLLPANWLRQAAEPYHDLDSASAAQTLEVKPGVNLYGWDTQAAGIIGRAALDSLLDRRTLKVAISTGSGSALGLSNAPMLGRLGESSEEIAQSLPQPCIADPNLLRLKETYCGLDPHTGTITQVYLALDAFTDDAWHIWPGVIALSNVQLRFAIIRPPDLQRIVSFSLEALLTLETLPLLVKAHLPVATLSGRLNPKKPPPSLNPLVERLFGQTLQGDMTVHQLEFWASISRSSYGAILDIKGDLSFDIDEGKKIAFSQLRVRLVREGQKTQGDLEAAFRINDHNHFAIKWALNNGNTLIEGHWKNPKDPVDFNDILDALHLPRLPDLPGELQLKVSDASFDFNSANTSFTFSLITELRYPQDTASANVATMTLVVGRNAQNNKWGFLCVMQITMDFTLRPGKIPVVGEMVQADADNVRLDRLRLIASTRHVPALPPDRVLKSLLPATINSGLSLAVDLQAGTEPKKTLQVRFGAKQPRLPQKTAAPVQAAQKPAQIVKTPAPVDIAPEPVETVEDQDAEKIHWLDIQRSFGPLQMQRIGFTVKPTGAMGVLLDAGIETRGLGIMLNGLEVDIPLKAPFNPEYSLSGLGVEYRSRSLNIIGALGKSRDNDGNALYSGLLSVTAGVFGATALGSYTTLNGAPSFSAFTFISAPLGGPPCFFVTGLAGGIGYNRLLKLPEIDKVAEYPLIQGAMGSLSAKDAQQNLKTYITPMAGQDWLAAGVRFTSFQMLRSFALLTVSFGTRNEIALLGQSTLTLPVSTTANPKAVVAQADLLIRACLQLDEGLLAVNAQLSPASFIFSRDARLTGGFAFYMWFGNSPHAGDFVVTLGGYHPQFDIPKHYPQVPRLGLNWHVSDNLTMKGELYFAVTPSVIMAGGVLDATWRSDAVQAWFQVQTHFLIRFKPFTYRINAAVSIGVSARVDLWLTSYTLNARVSANLEMWGPDFGGRAVVDLSVLSFTIEFGSQQRPNDAAIGWAEFRDSFLHVKAETTTETVTTQSPLITISAPVGMLGTGADNDKNPIWKVDGASLRLALSTQIPSTLITGSLAPETTTWNQDLGVGPMGKGPGTLKSTLTVSLTRNNKPDDGVWEIVPVLGGVPSGLWSNTGNGMAAQAVVPRALLGLSLHPEPVQAQNALAVAVSTLQSPHEERLEVAWSPSEPVAMDDYAHKDAMDSLRLSLQDPAVSEARHGILAALRRQGLNTAAQVNPTVFSTPVADVLLDAPVLSSLGGCACP